MRVSFRGFVAVVVVALGLGVAWRFTVKARAEVLAQPSNRPPPVRVVQPSQAAKEVVLSLPGSIRPREHVVLYARTNGFLRQWKVDLGDRVKKGQVLAFIDSPEVVANLAQARARLAQAKASIGLVHSQHERVVALAKDGTSSPQDVDASALRVAAAESELTTAGAEVERLQTLVGFQTVTAPFDGTIIKRMVDNGALVNPGSTALFELASTDDLLIDVDVPQWLSAQVIPGTPAKVTVGKDPAVLDAEVFRTAGALDPSLRTLGVQLKFKNPQASVPSGSYAQVKFEVPRGEPAISLPGAVVAVRNGVSTVGVVQSDGSMHFVPVKLVRDMGRDVELQGDLQLGMKVALYPSPSLSDGDRVTPVEGKQ